MQVCRDFGGEVFGIPEVGADGVVCVKLSFEGVELGGLRGVGLALFGGDGRVVFEVDEAGQAAGASAAVFLGRVAS